jgi:drug/metabolite transporter (DMT)-like permease
MPHSASLSPRSHAATIRLGAGLVFGSALVWSFGGALARFLPGLDSWTVVFWRCLFAALFLLAFMLVRDGPRGTMRLFAHMGLPGLYVAFSFATASTCFILAIGYTTVANVVLIQAGVPLLAALMAWIFYRENISLFTWAAILAVILGVAIMVYSSLGAVGSFTGIALAILIAVVFAGTTVVTRRYTAVRMSPAACLGSALACLVAATQAPALAVDTAFQFGILFLLGACNLGLGMALFVTGARLIPSAVAALLGTMETVLSPVWVGIIHGEIPAASTIIGGVFVLIALLAYLTHELKRQQALAG